MIKEIKDIEIRKRGKKKTHKCDKWKMREWEENRTSKPPPTPSVKKIRKYKRELIHQQCIELYIAQ